jgi:hypothetical protein
VKCTLTPMAGDGTGVRGPQESVLIPNYSSALPSKHLFFEWSRGDSNPDRRRAKSELYRRRRAAHTIGHRPNRASYKHKRVSKTATELGVMAGLVVVLTIALFFVRRTHRSERETARSS